MSYMQMKYVGIFSVVIYLDCGFGRWIEPVTKKTALIEVILSTANDDETQKHLKDYWQTMKR